MDLGARDLRKRRTHGRDHHMTPTHQMRGSMNGYKRQLKVFGFCLLAFLVLAVTGVSFAQAAEWKINGEKLTKEAPFTGLAVSSIEEYLFFVPEELSLDIHCFAKLWIEAVLLPSGESHGTYRFDECKVFQLGNEEPECKPTKFEMKFKSSLLLHEKQTYILFSAREGNLGVIKFAFPCPLAETYQIKGSYVMECINESCEKEALVHTMEPASVKLFPSDKLTLGTREMTFKGRDVIEPIGEYLGKVFSAIG
jgi:hypothetical protein